MARKFIAGILAGTVVSGLGLSAASLMTDLPGEGAPQAGEASVPAGSEFNQSREDGEAVLPGASGATETGTAPEMDVPEPDDLSPLDGADTEPAAQPQADMSGTEMTAPDEGEQSALALAEDDPVLPGPQADAPPAPAGEEDLSISTDPAQPATPEVDGQSGAFPSDEVAEAAVTPDASTGEATPDVPDDATDDAAGEAPADDDASGKAANAQAQTEDVAALPGSESEPDEPSGTVGNLAENVETGRLPSISDDADTEAEPAVSAGGEEDLAADAPPEALPALEAFAAPFENPEGKPLMSIVLIDDGSSPIGLDALSAFPYPLSFALDPTDAAAARAMTDYRAAGFDVLVLADLPEGASATDTETAMQVILDRVPEAVAVIEGTQTGVQSSREAAEQLAPILLETGHGLVLFSKGLDTTGKLISREGVPTAMVFRDFDGNDQNATVIRRFLDQAAFKAGRDEGGVIMLGRLRAETVSALLIWGLQDRASQIALAPVSAVLRNAADQ